VCAPGRLLHHMDSTPGFECNNLQILVLDEADRCLDMGFSKTMDAISQRGPYYSFITIASPSSGILPPHAESHIGNAG
jgi:superfamily II DNA/RNA helicase